MATPESNAALGIGLFQPAANVITQGNDRKVALLQRIAEIANQQEFQRQQLGQQQAGAVNLERLRTENQQITNDKALDRQLKVSQQAQDAADIKELHRQFALAYPAYAKAAAAADLEVTPLSEYSQSWDGLGELSADLGVVQEKLAKKDNSLAALPILGAARAAKHELDVSRAAFAAKSQLTAEDQAAARNAGIQALQVAKDQGIIKDIPDKAFGAGVAALTAGDTKEAEQKFGAAAPRLMSLFEQGQQRSRLQIMNSPERRAELAAIGRDVVAARQGLNQTMTHLAGAAAKNPEVGAGYQQLETELMAGDKQDSGTRSDAERNQMLFNAAGAGTGNTPSPTPRTQAPASAGNYQYPGLSILGATERMNIGPLTAPQFAAAPANILAAPGRAIDTGGRLLSGAIQGIYNGNFTPPPTGAVEMAGRGIGSLLPSGPTDTDNVAAVQNEIQRLTPSAGQPDVGRRLEYLRRLLQSYSTQPSSGILAPAGY